MTRLGQLLCALRGHDAVLHFEPGRVLLRCTSCGHDSPGWTPAPRSPRPRLAGDPSKLHLSGLRLVRAA